MQTSSIQKKRRHMLNEAHRLRQMMKKVCVFAWRRRNLRRGRRAGDNYQRPGEAKSGWWDW